MERYKDYKDSGADWLDEIPKHWHLKRIKDLTKIISKGTTPSTEGETYTNSGVRFIKAENLKENGKVVDNPVFFISEKTNEILKRSQLKANDLLLVIAGATTGKIAVIQETQLPANTNQAVCFLRLKKEEQRDSLRYKFYFINSSSFQSLIWLFAVTSAQPNLPMSILSRIDFCYPPLLEQTQIANYLDARTTSIDKKINLLKQKIKHYKAYRKTLINEAVTKGLDKTVKLKDSDVNWIGEIPAHWEVKRLKDVSKIFTGNSISDKSMFETKKDSFNYIATKDINIHNKKVNYDNGVYIPKNDKSFKITKRNTSLICLEGASAGNKLTFVDKEVAFVNKLCAIKSSDKNVFDKYVFYQLQSSLFRSQFFELLSGLIGGVSLGLLKYFNVVIPSKKEQQQIADFLDAKTNTVDNIVNNIETQITTLKELRKTLINEVVTGKVKVTA